MAVAAAGVVEGRCFLLSKSAFPAAWASAASAADPGAAASGSTECYRRPACPAAAAADHGFHRADLAAAGGPSAEFRSDSDDGPFPDVAAAVAAADAGGGESAAEGLAVAPTAAADAVP